MQKINVSNCWKFVWKKGEEHKINYYIRIRLNNHTQKFQKEFLSLIRFLGFQLFFSLVIIHLIIHPDINPFYLLYTQNG